MDMMPAAKTLIMGTAGYIFGFAFKVNSINMALVFLVSEVAVQAFAYFPQLYFSSYSFFIREGIAVAAAFYQKQERLISNTAHTLLAVPLISGSSTLMAYFLYGRTIKIEFK